MAAGDRLGDRAPPSTSARSPKRGDSHLALGLLLLVQEPVEEGPATAGAGAVEFAAQPEQVVSEGRPAVDLMRDRRKDAGTLLSLDLPEGAASAEAGLDPADGVLKCVQRPWVTVSASCALV